MLMGCRMIDTSIPCLTITLRINKRRIPNNKGSVGKNISIGKPYTNSLSCIETGVAKTIKSKSLSRANMAKNKKTRRKGTNKNTNFSLAIK